MSAIRDNIKHVHAFSISPTTHLLAGYHQGGRAKEGQPRLQEHFKLLDLRNSRSANDGRVPLPSFAAICSRHSATTIFRPSPSIPWNTGGTPIARPATTAFVYTDPLSVLRSRRRIRRQLGIRVSRHHLLVVMRLGCTTTRRLSVSLPGHGEPRGPETGKANWPNWVGEFQRRSECAQVLISLVSVHLSMLLCRASCTTTSLCY